MPKTLSARDRLVAILASRTQRKAARLLGVSDRTIRRWKNEGVQPNARNDARLSKYANIERHKIIESNRRTAGNRQPLPKMPGAVAIGKRRRLRTYRRGVFTGNYHQSDWINYDVKNFDRSQLFSFLCSLRDQAAGIQIIFQIPKGCNYPPDSRGRHGRMVQKNTRVAGQLEYLGDRDNGEIMDLIDYYLTHGMKNKQRTILYVGVKDVRRVVKKVKGPNEKKIKRAKRKK